MLSRSQDAYWSPQGPFAAGPHLHQAPGPYESPRDALASRFAAMEVSLHDTLAPRFAAMEVSPHDTLAPRFAAMEVSPHDTLAPRFAATEVSLHDMLAPRSAAMEVSPRGATLGEEQAGQPALLAAGACLHSLHPGRTLPVAKCRIGCMQHRC